MLGGRNDPVLPEVADHQQEWEELVFGALQVRHFPEAPRYKRLPGSLRSLCAIPGAAGLRVNFASAGCHSKRACVPATRFRQETS